MPDEAATKKVPVTPNDGVPIIAFDNVAGLALQSGLILIGLNAYRINPGPEATMDQTTVAHLRMSYDAASNLRDGLNRAIKALEESRVPHKKTN